MYERENGLLSRVTIGLGMADLPQNRTIRLGHNPGTGYPPSASISTHIDIASGVF
jgi:hypothetical protein